ncbi:acetyl-CoA carboxylase, carboxyltransferase subunit beta [Parasphingopyxis marina]|uniref:Acetyl-coenzyme A carboxylase carboxyl transferase subunit beta n=1 Tax=Parasphingopyxis marina TaxID=2761622 RepID=A0A842HYF5_9SPHN|nr:acetyl-CoA carboxylase, carboxyltransferase subunit beta [Parasphingopyxis marina]MBC2777962.1 acetyl-CoA carboxylase carboxyltransferase subunit beta [Parasphingopyxis marina]
MNWFNKVRNRIPFISKRSTEDTLWHKCRDCDQMIFIKEYEENQSVCPECGFHGRIGPMKRFLHLFDEHSWEVLASPKVKEDPLKFRDQKKYIDRLKAARAATGESDAFLNAKGTIHGKDAIIGVQDFAFMGGSMGLAVGEAFVRGARAAIAAQCPYIVFTASGGARMQEGALSLMQMPKMTVAVEELREAGLPYIVVLTDPTSGGVMASYAMLGDVQIAEPKALLAFTGRRVIENTIREKLPDNFQSAEYLLEHGALDMIVARADLRDTLGKLIDYMTPARAAA